MAFGDTRGHSHWDRVTFRGGLYVGTIGKDSTTFTQIINSSGTFVGTFEPAGNIIPGTDAAFTLGSASFRFTSLFLSGRASVGTVITDTATLSTTTFPNQFNLTSASATALAVFQHDASNGASTFVAITAATAGTGDLIGAYLNGGVTRVFQVSNAGVITIGTGTATEHVLNTLLATNGAQAMTLLNGPAAATAGNPVGWVKKTINGTTRYQPFW